MRIHDSLDGLFKTGRYVRVLRALFRLPSALPVSRREIARRAGISHPSASAILDALAEQGVLKVTRVPRADLFELNRDHIAVERLHPLFEWEKQVSAQLQSFLRERLDSIEGVRSAHLFGSVAEGTEGPSSDVDLAVRFADGYETSVSGELETLAEAVRARFGNSLMAMTRAESASADGEPAIWGSVRRSGIPLIDRQSAGSDG